MAISTAIGIWMALFAATLLEALARHACGRAQRPDAENGDFLAGAFFALLIAAAGT